MNRLSRREFVRLGAAGAVPAFALPSREALGRGSPTLLVEPVSGGGMAKAGLTAQEIVNRIKNAVGVEWKADTVDTFKAGDPSTVVTGVVTTSLATIDVLRRAVKIRANLVITCGPTFYSRADSAAPPSSDPVLTAKNEFIKTNNLVVWRFSDHWRLHTPDPFTHGLTEVLGWAQYRASDDPRRVTISPVTLDALVADVKATLNARGGMRIIGDPRARVQKIGVLPGSTPIRAALTLLPQVDVIIAGEVREWESAEYVRDAVSAGLDKGLILVGRTLSEDTGMNVCAQWLATIVSDVPIRWMPVGDLYWRPT